MIDFTSGANEFGSGGIRHFADKVPVKFDLEKKEFSLDDLESENFNKEVPNSDMDNVKESNFN